MENNNFINVWAKKFNAKGAFDYVSLNINHIVYISLHKDGFLISLINGEKLLAFYDKDINLKNLPIDKFIMASYEPFKGMKL